MNKREFDHPVELESQFIMRLPEEPAKALKHLLKSGENLKNRLSIQLENDMRHGEVRFDHWLLNAKIVDLPTIVESLKTIDRKSVYKTADICQLMLCKYEPEPSPTEEELPNKNKKKDPLRVDKKFLWPHGITPPTKNVRKRRFRKTLKKKSAEAPEIEKEVKRLLSADNEAFSVTWEVIKEEDDHSTKPEPSTSVKIEKATKKDQKIKTQSELTKQSSKVEDIFGGALSDSDLEDENINIDMEDSKLSYEGNMSDSDSILGTKDFKDNYFATQFKSEMFSSHPIPINTNIVQPNISMAVQQSRNLTEKRTEQHPTSTYVHIQTDDKTKLIAKLQQLSAELEELKQRRQRTQHEISGMENMTLRQRFQDILQTLNQDIMYKEMEYQNLQAIFK